MYLMSLFAVGVQKKSAESAWQRIESIQLEGTTVSSAETETCYP